MTRGVLLRGIGFAVAIALGAVAVWLIVTSTSQKRIELGVLAGLWAALVGAFAIFGSRRLIHPVEVAAVPAGAVGHSAALELRSAATELQRAEEAAARRAHEARLEQLLREEIRASVTREIATLRAEIAQLRSELLEKVGGQLRLERIETTRVIGSDLEALQQEVRQLKAVARQDTGEFATVSDRARTVDTGPFRHIVEPARIRPVTRETAAVEDDVQPARLRPEPVPPSASPTPTAPPAAPSPAPAETTGPIRISTAEPLRPFTAWAPADRTAEGRATPPPAEPMRAEPMRAEPTPAEPTPGPPVRPQPVGERSGEVPSTRPVDELASLPRPVDELASLPRLRPFTDFELDPIEPAGESAALRPHDRAGRPDTEEPAYTGRRRRDDGEPGAGRHADDDEPTGRRHRRADEDENGNDLLERLLAREGVRH